MIMLMETLFFSLSQRISLSSLVFIQWFDGERTTLKDGFPEDSGGSSVVSLVIQFIGIT